MMNFKVVIFSILVYVLLYVPTIFGQDSSGSSRWGIVTKEPVGEKAPPADDTNHAKESKVTVTPAPSENPPNPVPPDPKKETKKSVDLESEDAASGDKNKQSSEAAPAISPSTRDTDGKQKPAATAKETPPTIKDIKWASEAQKSTCQNYLQQMQDQFLKTRHYSIQGVPCQTADHAEEFLQLAGKCENECPKGLVERGGYSSRIMRNIRWLGKLGNDQCGDTQPVTKTAPKAPHAEPQTSK